MEQLRLTNRNGWKLIHHTVSKNYFPRVKNICTTHPAELETRSIPEGFTPLLVAASTGALESFNVLLQAGANDSAVSFKGETVVQLAASAGQSQLLMKAMTGQPFTPERVLHELSVHLQNNRVSLNPEHFTNTLTTLAAVLNHLATMPEQCKESEFIVNNRLIETIEVTIKRLLIQGRMILPAIAVCKVIEGITLRVTADKVTDSKILPYLLNMIDVMNNDSVTLHVLTAISQVVYHSSNIDLVLAVIGGPRALVDALEIHTSKELQLVLMDCIAYSSKSKKMSECLVNPDIMKKLVNIFSTGNDSKVYVSTVNALLSLVGNDAGARECLIQIGAVEVILKSLKPIDTLATEPTMKLIRRLCTGDGLVQKIVQKHPKTISIFMNYTKHSMSINIQQMTFEILWSIAAENLAEKRALATALGAECLLSLVELGDREVQVLAVQALLPLTQPFHCLQNKVIEAGAIISLVKTIRNTEEDTTRVCCLRALENLSYQLPNKPNYLAQQVLQDVDGIQLLLRISGRNCYCSEHALCTLASFSLKNKSIRTTLLCSKLQVLQEVLRPHQRTDFAPSETKSRTLCNLAYGCMEMQSQIISHGGMLLSSFINQMSMADSDFQKVDIAFQVAVLARMFTDSKQSEATLFALKFLVKAVQMSLAEVDVELQMHTTARISGLLLMRAGITDAMVSLHIIPLVIQMLSGTTKGPKSVAAITLCLLTTSPHGSREILKHCRRNPKLSTTMRRYSCGQQPSRYFTENWRVFLRTQGGSRVR